VNSEFFASVETSTGVRSARRGAVGKHQAAGRQAAQQCLKYLAPNAINDHVGLLVVGQLCDLNPQIADSPGKP
jgi:hypothetical protein